MRDALYIAAKAPRAGFAKTRLGREIGHERAVAFYAAFLSDLAEDLVTRGRGAHPDQVVPPVVDRPQNEVVPS